MSKNIRWLHLSDFHIGQDNYEEIKLFSYILKHIKENVDKGFIPDFIFITGDIANKGKKSEYKSFVDSFLIPLIDILQLEIWSDKIFILPGNHDIDRKFVCDVNRENHLLASSKFFQPTMEGKEKRRINEGRAFQNFSEFLDDADLGLDNWLNSEKASFSNVLNVKKQTIGIVGINTAWLSQDNNDKEKLSPGIDLLEESIKKIQHCKLKILLGHHPLDWLHKESRQTIEAILSDNEIIYLHGHLHENRLDPAIVGNGKFLQIQSGAAFHVKEHSNLKYKNGLLWAEVDFDASTLYLQPRYWKDKERRWGISDDLHEDMRSKCSDKLDWWGFSLPNIQSSLSSQKERTIELEAPDGWSFVNEDFFIGREKNLITEETYIQYFDGATPNWNRAFLKRLPFRENVKEASDILIQNINNHEPSLTLFTGAGGEGKSTALHQCAVQLFEKDFNILIHKGIEELSIDYIKKLSDKEAYVFISDDADKMVKNLEKLIDFLKTEKKNIHFLLAARKSDWFAVKGNEYNWRQKVIYKEILLGKLSFKESDRVISLWSEFGEQGLKDLSKYNHKEAVKRLHEASNDQLSMGDGAFLGAMLEIRLADGLKDHIRLLLTRLENRKIKNSSYTLLDAFAAIALMHKEGLHYLSPPVLAEYLYQDAKKNIRGNIINQLGKEAAATHAGDYVYTRHSIIANAASELLENEFDISIVDLYTNLGLAAVYARENMHIPNFRFWQYDYPEYFMDNNESYIAISIAEKQFQHASSDTFLLTNLTKLYRNTNDNDKSLELFRSFEGKINDDRILYHEWAIVEGLAGNIESSLILDATAISDFGFKKPPTNNNAKFALLNMSKYFSIMYDTYHSEVFRDMRLASSSLGIKLKLNKEERENFTYHIKESINQGAKRHKLEVTFDFFIKNISNLWEYVDDILVDRVPTKNEIMFEKFKILIDGAVNRGF